MKIKDLTQEQLMDIVNLIHSFKDSSDFKFIYQPYENEDDGEYQLIKFQGDVFGNRKDTIRVFIYSNLDCDIDYSVDNKSVRRLPVRNQKLIQQKFVEFGF